MDTSISNSDIPKSFHDIKHPILQLKNICFSYHSLMGETEVLKNVSFSFILSRERTGGPVFWENGLKKPFFIICTRSA